ncbi:hypothetical protein RMHFA_04641 [Roseomonas mucosa]|uniref:Uncharacterized protein n=1 Tax=Roseomonas mucosa TaxID=207340 RepID=A0A4Y1N3Q2_9PROT|nr:hypothetical protein RADP37_04641 [Roseomonas mucosa]QDD96641.1 hypothetical protein HVIM_04641 [Roseomonas mucosa]QDE01643.1 hypothetical protein ADP8_04641 [Roseomonas mucosa]UZO93929.1 hypothetical protein RMP42_04641 [Roseomonas mucosa]UZO98685.1 hypothetical protein RMHFA_04641 [Roseomonas mucosa]
MTALGGRWSPSAENGGGNAAIFMFACAGRPVPKLSETGFFMFPDEKVS